jgi:hypothetical protein
MDRRDEQNLGDRRAFLKKAVVTAGVAFAVPTILSTVRPTDLAAQVSGGGNSSANTTGPSGDTGGGRPPWAGGGKPSWAGGPGAKSGGGR